MQKEAKFRPVDLCTLKHAKTASCGLILSRNGAKNIQMNIKKPLISEKLEISGSYFCKLEVTFSIDQKIKAADSAALGINRLQNTGQICLIKNLDS